MSGARCDRVVAMIFIVIGLAALATKSSVASVSESELPDPLEAGWKGKDVCEILDEDELQRILRCTFGPGEGHERHHHPPHAGYTLAGGRMRITDAEGTRVVEPPVGQAWTSNGIPWHEVENVGDTTAVYLIFEAKSSARLPVSQE